MQIQTKKTLSALAVCLPFVVAYFMPIQPNAFTYTFVHANIFHLVANMWALFMFTKYAGNKETLVCFVIGGYIASMVSYSLYGGDYHSVVGASGFVFGIVGMYLIFRYRGLNNPDMYKSGLFISIVVFLAVGLFIPSIAGLLHIYALVDGMLIGYMLILAQRFLRNLQQYM